MNRMMVRRRYVPRAPIRRRRVVARRYGTRKRVTRKRLGGYKRTRGTVARGYGEYRVRKNTLISTYGDSGPVIKNVGKEGSIYICKKEFITPIYAGGTTGPNGTAFNLQKFRVNPAAVETFPWLATVGPANGYEQWAPYGIIFHYHSLSSNSVINSPGSGNTLGRISIASYYDTSLPDPTNVQQMLQSMYSNDISPDKDLYHFIECERKQSVLANMYIANSSLPASVPPQFVHLCNTYVSTDSCPNANANVLLGELHVSYCLKLAKSYLPPPGELSEEQAADKFQITSPTSSGFIVNGVNVSLNQIGGTITGPQTYTFPNSVQSGLFLVTYNCEGTVGATGANYSIQSSQGSSFQFLFSDDTGFNKQRFAVTPNPLTVTNNISISAILKITNPVLPVSFTFGNAAIPTGTVFADFMVSTMSASN